MSIDDRIDKYDVAVPAIGAIGWARWAWRQLTSMRVALLLLVLLALAAVPGSIFPQRPQNPAAVAAYLTDNPGVGTWLDRLGFFDVYASPWFSAIYLLLFISLVGCIVPRTRQHWRAWRSDPPRTPARLERFEDHETFETALPAADVLARSRSFLTSRMAGVPRYRVVAGDATVSAERGYVRETGNIVFHLALVGLLIAMAVGQFFHYRAQVVVVQGQTAVNSALNFDSLETGSAFDIATLEPFTVRLDSFDAEFTVTGRATFFSAGVTDTRPGQVPQAETIKVNHPLDVGGTLVYLQGNGYAPVITVRDEAGMVVFSGAVPFPPTDASYTSRGVVKAPDVSTGEQIGLLGWLFPTAAETDSGLVSLHPEALDPVLLLTAYTGDLGLDTGIPQNVYQLDTTNLTQVTNPDGTPVVIELRPGQSQTLDGVGTISFESLQRFVAFDFRYDPALVWVLISSLLALAGLAVSLFLPRRRMWVRVAERDGRTVVTAAALARGDDAGLPAELQRLVAAIKEDE